MLEIPAVVRTKAEGLGESGGSRLCLICSQRWSVHGRSGWALRSGTPLGPTSPGPSSTTARERCSSCWFPGTTTRPATRWPFSTAAPAMACDVAAVRRRARCVAPGAARTLAPPHRSAHRAAQRDSLRHSSRRVASGARTRAASLKGVARYQGRLAAGGHGDVARGGTHRTVTDAGDSSASGRSEHPLQALSPEIFLPKEPRQGLQPG